MPLRPLNDVLIVEPDKNERFDSSLVLPENNSIEKISRFATVISAGRRCLYKWSFGDRILINRFFDTPMYVFIDGKKYRIIREHYVEARLEP